MSAGDDRTMNCEEFKQAVAADPSFDGAAAHAMECAKCSTYQAEMQALDLKIASAMALEAPGLTMPDLPEIDTTNVTTLPRRPMMPAWFAVAATVVIAAVFGIRMLGTDMQSGTLADQIIAHIDHEPYGLRVTDVPVSEQRLQTVVPDGIAKMDHSAGLISYAQSCEINGRDVPHLVIQGEYGPVTILLMPKEYVAEASAIEGDNINGIIVPVGDGSIAIVGVREERLDKIQKRVMDSVEWDI
jgi:hypothetical protein